MAVITPTVTYAPNGHRNSVVVNWAAITDSDTCGPVELPDWVDGSFQAEGTFSSATVALVGSNDGTNYEAITDPQGNAISKTAAGASQITENMRYMKPTTTGGSSSSVDVTLNLRKP